MAKQTKDDVEQRLLDAAEKFFIEKGMKETKTTDIAAAAGVTHAMLHYYFRTKESLFERIFDKIFDQILQYFDQFILDKDEPVLDAVQRFAGDEFDIFMLNKWMPQFVVREVLSNEERRDHVLNKFAPVIQKGILPLQEKLDREAAEGKIRQINAFMLLLDVISLNTFPFISDPVSTTIGKKYFGSEEEFFKLRRQETLDMIRCRLAIQPDSSR